MEISADWLARILYVVLCLLALFCWYSLTRRLPRYLGLVLMVLAVAFLFAPVVTDGPNPAVAPASMALLLGIIAKDSTLIIKGVSPILWTTGVVFTVLFIGNILNSLLAKVVMPWSKPE